MITSAHGLSLPVRSQSGASGERLVEMIEAGGWVLDGPGLGADERYFFLAGNLWAATDAESTDLECFDLSLEAAAMERALTPPGSDGDADAERS